jgi:hypothetical protein
MTLAMRLMIFLATTFGLVAADPVLKVTSSIKALAFTPEQFAALPHEEITALTHLVPGGTKDNAFAGRERCWK